MINVASYTKDCEALTLSNPGLYPFNFFPRWPKERPRTPSALLRPAGTLMPCPQNFTSSETCLCILPSQDNPLFLGCFFLNLFYWSIVDLQCCVSSQVCSRVIHIRPKWSVSRSVMSDFLIPWTVAHQAPLPIELYIYVRICIYTLFHILFHYGLLQDIEYSSLCSYSRTLLFILSMYNSLHLLTPNFQPIITPLGNYRSVLCLWVCFCFVEVHLWQLLDPTYKWYHMVFVFA